MTLVYGAKQYTEADGPMVHALIMGVGHYPNLSVGVSSNGAVPNLPPLGNLASPPASAYALADWFIDVLGKAERPPNPKLGSVELLISESPSAGGPPGEAVYREKAIERATLDNITARFADWFDRCDANPGNIAFFHFCGHGLEAPLHMLLPEDFNRSRRNPWKDAIDFYATYRAMTNCKADNQFYVVDACREWNKELLLVLSPKGVSLLEDNPERQMPRYASILFGAARSRPAYGDAAGGTSELTRVLIECLNGGAAKWRMGRWRVNISEIGKSASLLVKYENRSRTPDDVHNVDPTIGEAPSTVQQRDLFVLDKTKKPSVRVVLDCLPYDASERVTFCLHPPGTAHPDSTAPCTPPGGALGSVRTGPWITTVPPGTYDVFGRFIDNPPGYADINYEFESFNPPVWPDWPTDDAIMASPVDLPEEALPETLTGTGT